MYHGCELSQSEGTRFGDVLNTAAGDEETTTGCGILQSTKSETCCVARCMKWRTAKQWSWLKSRNQKCAHEEAPAECRANSPHRS